MSNLVYTVGMNLLYHNPIVHGMVWIAAKSSRSGAIDKMNNLQKNSDKRRRHVSGVSPVISATILMAITVTMGLSLWSMVASQSNSSSESFANEITDYVNYVNERYTVVNMAFGYDDPKINACNTGLADSKCATVWVYNFSEKDVKVVDVLFGKSSVDQRQVSGFKMLDNNMLKANSLGNITLPIDSSVISDSYFSSGFPHDGKTYYVTVVTEGGSSQAYYQTDKVS